ncbi:MAG: serine hydrolase [Phycisphaerales bacterium]
MKQWWTIYAVLLTAAVLAMSNTAPAQPADDAADPAWVSLDIDALSAGDQGLTLALARLDTALRRDMGIEADQTAVGLLDMTTGRFAMLRADTQYYAASIPKIAILLSYFQTHPLAADELDDTTRHELGLMIKQSDNALAAKYSQIVGLTTIADILTSPTYKLYDAEHGGGLWMGKHYGPSDERNRDPLAGESHAATVRQLLRYYLMLEQGRLVSPQASQTMREIFASPDIEHLNGKIVKGLAGRDVTILRKSGTWSDWYGDTAIVKGEGRHYVLAVLTHIVADPEKEQDTPIGEAYIVRLSRCIDDWALAGFTGEAPTGEPAPATEAP